MGHQKQWIAIFTAVDLEAVSNGSAGHLRRSSDADTTKQCLSRDIDASILSWPTTMGHQKQWIAIFTA
eukprot:scaffold1556_cov85-Skeletonema_dohrnii-CCMP3373.AAC.1